MNGISGIGNGQKSTGITIAGSSVIKNSATTATSPINRLITVGAEKLSGLFKKASLTSPSHRISVSIEHPKLTGEINFEVLALPQPEKSSRFWDKVKAHFAGTEQKQLEPTPLQISPTIYSDQYLSDFHTQLMVRNPYVVLEDGTHYAICITAPDTLTGQWEDFQESAELFSTKIEIGKKRRSLAMVVRVDNSQPLIRQKEVGFTDLEIYQEMLVGFQPAQKTPNTIYAAVAKRVTVPAKKVGDLGIGDETITKAVEEDLIFSIPPKGTIKGDVEDKKGLVEVVIYLVEDRKVSEIIEKPILTSLPGDHIRTLESFTFRGGASKGFSAGETTFGKETRKKVDITGVKVIEPLTAFRVVLVGENREINQTMELGEQV